MEWDGIYKVECIEKWHPKQNKSYEDISHIIS